MSKHEKTLSRLCTEPEPSDIRWAELKSLMLYLGFKELKNDGSRRKFFHEDKDIFISCHEPHNPALVRKGAVRDIAKFLKENGFT